MMKFLKYWMIPIFFIGCTKISNKNSIECIPEIIVERNKDTLHIGEIFEAKIYLSSDKYYTTVMDGDTVRVSPLFELDGELGFTNEDFFFFKEKVTGDTVTYRINDNYFVREFSIGVLFPHPNHGEVKITENFAYIIKNK